MAFNIYSSSSGPLSFYFSFLWSDFCESCRFWSGSNLIVGSSFHSGLVCSFCIGQFITKANFFPLAAPRDFSLTFRSLAAVEFFENFNVWFKI